MKHSMGNSRFIFSSQSTFSDKNTIQRSLQQAIELQQNGNLAAAERKYRGIIKKLPNHSETLQRLAILLQQTGHASSALHYMQKALNSDPENSELLKNLAEIYRIQGDFDKALDYAEKSLSRQADNVDALVILAAACFEQYQPKQAIENYSRALEINPHDVFVRNELANALCAVGKHSEAAEQYRRALSQFPDFDDCRINLADTLIALEIYDEAVDHYQLVIKRQSNNAVVQNRLGIAFEKQGKIDQATECYEKALDLDPKLVEACLNLGKCLLVRDPNAAEKCFSSVLAIEPGDASGYYWLGIHAQTMGNFDAATSYFLTALDLNPEFTDAWYRISMNRDFIPSVEQLETLEGQFNDRINESPDDERLITLGFTLGQFKEQCGSYDASFEYYHSANRLKARLHGFDKAEHDAQINDIIDTFDSTFYHQRNTWGSHSELPLFIVGMPRSGTSLVEQILSAHPLNHGAGELNLMLDLVASLKNTVSTSAKSHAGRFKDLDENQVADLAHQYLLNLQVIEPAAKRIMDKLPGNYLRLGIIFLLFPAARVIHCKRDPMDTCWSCYQQNFEQGLHFTNDLENMGHAYRGYQKLMAHWQGLFPDRICDIQYEDLLEDQVSHSRRLLQHCGLEWHPEVSNFTDSHRPVTTASLWQVRQPVYKTSVGRWRNYRSHLDPLKKALSK